MKRINWIMLLVLFAQCWLFASAQTDEKLITSQEQQRAQAMVLLKQQKWPEAKVRFVQLIQEQPQQIELYINLAAIYARQKKLDKARTVLIDGINANQPYDVLYQSLLKVQGALAAQAYRQALNEKQSASELELPIVNTRSE